MALHDVWANGGIGSMAKFYDSIPDYFEINNLTKEEFESTLNTLKSTSRTLRRSWIVGDSHLSSSLSFHSRDQIIKDLKNGKPQKQRSYKKHTKKSAQKRNDGTHNRYDSNASCSCYSSIITEQKKNIGSTSGSLITGDEWNVGNNLHNYSLPSKMKEKVLKGPEFDEMPCHNGKLHRRSLSLNDINKNTDQYTKFKCSSLESGSQTNDFGKFENDRKTLRKEKSKNVVGHTIVTTESHQESTIKNLSNNAKIPFSLFKLGRTNFNGLHSALSPSHPVARPNLAAKLRAEVSKRKVHESKNRSSASDVTSHFDWEVRKTPAWRSLTHNETHKEMLLLRLATRKAEQDLQKREYEQTMKLMQQRVKSAPLLLEGKTYLSPQVGKLTHTCATESKQQPTNIKKIDRLIKKTGCKSGGTRKSHKCVSIQRQINKCIGDKLSSFD